MIDLVFIYIRYIGFVKLFCWYIHIILQTVKWFQVLLCNFYNVISVICLHVLKWFQVLRFNANYSVQHYSLFS